LAETDEAERAPAAGGFSKTRLVPLLALAAAAALFFGFGLHEHLTFESLRDNRESLLSWVGDNRALAAALFAGLYAVVVVFIPPSGTIMTVAGGFIFGSVLATIYTVCGATVGATALFLAVKLSIGDFLLARAGNAVKKMEAGFRENEMSYMLVLRLIPLFPFWLVNIAPAFLGVRLRTFVIGTAVGIIPGTFVYALVGNGLGAVFDAGGTPDLGVIFEPEILAPIVGLALLSLVPVAYKKIKARNAGAGTGGET